MYERTILHKYGIATDIERLSHQYPIKLVGYKDKEDFDLLMITEFEGAGGEIVGVMDAGTG